MPPRKKTAVVRGDPDAITLPTAATSVGESITDHNVVLYGSKGIGKSTLAAQFPNTIHFLWEPGRRNLKIPCVPDASRKEAPLTWPRFCDYIYDHVLDSTYRRVTIDTVDTCAVECDRWYASKYIRDGLVTVANQNDYGKSWAEMKSEFEAPFRALFASDIRVTFISHLRLRPRINRSRPREEAQSEPDIVQSTATGWAQEFMQVWCDFVLCYMYLDRSRILVVNGSEFIWSANGMMEDRFLQPSKSKERPGEPYHAFPAGTTPKEAFRNLQSAYDNQLEGIFLDVEES